MLIYVAGPLFSTPSANGSMGSRPGCASTASIASSRTRTSPSSRELTPEEVFRVDSRGVRDANILLAWLDGPVVDDGTACEIGMFAQLVAGGDPRYRGIVGLVTDLRLQRRRGDAAGDGMNLFVIGAIESAGRVCWSVDDAVVALRDLADEAAQ